MTTRTNTSRNGQQQLGVRIKELRRERGWSQRRLAQKCGLNRAHVGTLESGHSDVQLLTLLKIAKGLGVPLHSVAKGVGSR